MSWGSTRLYKRAISLIAIFAIIACLIPDAVGCQPFMNTTDIVHDIIYYHNDTVSYGPGIGTIVVTNPSLISPIIAFNLTLPNGTTRSIGSLNPPSRYMEDYAIENSEFSIPLKLSETVTPSSLYTGVQQEIRLSVEIENTGSGNITGFWYQKDLPPGLSTVWTAYDGGTLYVNDNITWTMDTLIPGEKKHLVIAFNITPMANVYYPAASVSYLYLAPLAHGEPGFSGYTNTSFHIKKSHPSNDVWYLEASVPNDNDLNMNLTGVSIYRSDASDPFTVSEIASHTPNVILNPGSAWNTSLIDHYGQVPAYFIKIGYTIPYTLDRRSFLTAWTEQSTIAVSGPPPTATPPPIAPRSNPYATWAPTAEPTPSPPPSGPPDIVFITPGSGDVITNNTTELETSVPPSSDPGYVVYYGSADNKTWVKLGESPIVGNVSELMWAVPQMDGKYYLKAEHYNSGGLAGIAFTQVLIAHEILPVDMTTMLISGTNLLMLLLALIALLLLLFIIMPYFLGKPVIYDSSALYALSRDKDWLSRLPRRTIRPDEFIADIHGADRIKMRPIHNIEEMRRLERERGLLAYDAMALQLAKETGALLYTADMRIVDIGKELDIDVKPLDKTILTIKR